MTVQYLGELVELDVYRGSQPGAEIARTSTDEAEPLTPRERVTLLLHRRLDLQHHTSDKQYGQRN